MPDKDKENVERLEREMQARQVLQNLAAETDTFMMACTAQAKAQMMYYKALLAEGFSAEQALYLTGRWHPFGAGRQ